MPPRWSLFPQAISSLPEVEKLPVKALFPQVYWTGVEPVM